MSAIFRSLNVKVSSMGGLLANKVSETARRRSSSSKLNLQRFSSPLEDRQSCENYEPIVVVAVHAASPSHW